MKEERDLYEFLAFKYAVAYTSERINEAFLNGARLQIEDFFKSDKGHLINKMIEIKGIKLEEK